MNQTELISKDLQPLFIIKRWSHHTKSGGYDRLCDDIPSTSVYVQKNKNIPLRSIRNRLRGKFLPSTKYSNTYRAKDVLAELNVFYKSLHKTTSIVHAIYAEDQLNYLLTYRNRLQAALTGTFHLPAESEFFQRVYQAGYTKRYSNLDAAIVVSKSMVSDYEDVVGKGKVFFIPHGIDTNVFTPGKNSVEHREDNSLNVLSIGIHGRDWKTVADISNQIKKSSKPVNFHVVVPSKYRSKFSENPEINLYSQISEERLIELYRKADLLLIPLRFATANNSLLEALACGTPVISTNIGGIPDYLDSASGWLLPKGDIKPILELINDLADNPHKLISKKIAARNKALQFDWKEIAKDVVGVYQIAVDRWKKNG